MTFTTEQLLALSNYFNHIDDLPFEIQNIADGLKESLTPIVDTVTASEPVVEAPVASDVVVEAVVETPTPEVVV